MCGAYFDGFVTDDRSFLQTLATIDGLPFTPMNIASFAKWLNSAEGSDRTHVGRSEPG